MRYTNKTLLFEIELDISRLHFTIRTFCHLIGVWIYRRWLWEFEFKKVGWCFYQKVSGGFGFIGIEHINYAKTTYRKDVKSQAIYRDMRFWRIFLRKPEIQYANKSEFFEIELDEFGFNVTIRTFRQLFAVYIRPRWRWDFDFKNVGWYFYQKVRFGFGFLRIEYINYAKSTYHRKEVRRKAIYRDMRFWRLLRKGEKNG